MSQVTFDLVMHPVRMQIIQACHVGRQLTAQQIGERLPDVPRATIDRHLQLLVDAGVLEIVGERERETGDAVERVYALGTSELRIPDEELARADPADHMRYFTTFVAGLLGSFGRYLSRPRINAVKDGVGYRQVTLNLSVEELATLVDDLNARLYRELDNEATPDRHAFAITRIVIPTDYPSVEHRSAPQGSSD